MKKIISTSEAPAAIGSYSQAVRSGNFLFCSGQIPLDPKSDQMVSGDIVKTTIFLTDLRDFQTVNEIYGSYFKNQPPARSTVQVSALPKGANVEIEVIAAADQGETSGETAYDTSG